MWPRTGEALQLAEPHAWTPLLCEMLQARCGFTPCVHLRSLYLCGGYPANCIEAYDLDSALFRKATTVVLPERSRTVAWVDGDTLTIISTKFTSRLRIGSGKMEVEEHTDLFVRPNSTPVLSGRFVYWVKNNVCFRVTKDEHPIRIDPFL